MEKEKTSTEQVSVETAVQEFIRFLPEEKRKDYELMIRRCNFHDPTEPMFPIMLFLLFFQESIGDSVARIEESVAELKGMPPPKCGKKEKSRFSILRRAGWVLIASAVAALLMFGLFRKNPPFAERTPQPAPQAAKHELQEINRYWQHKLKNDEAEAPSRQYRSGNGDATIILSAAAVVSAWIPAILVLLNWKRCPDRENRNDFPVRSRNRVRRSHRHKNNRKSKE